MNKINSISFMKKKRPVFVSWIILFLVMVFIAFLLMSVYFYSINGVLEQNLKEYNKAKVNQMKSKFDAGASALSIIAAMIADKEEMKDGSIMSFDARQKIVSEFALQLETTKDIFEIAIYLPKTEEILASSCVVKEQYYYSGYFDTERLPRTEWVNFLKSERTKYFCFLPFLNPRGEKDYKPTYVLRLDNHMGKIMIALNAENVLAAELYFSKMMIYNELGIPYCVYGEPVDDDFFINEKLFEQAGIFKAVGNSYISCADTAMPGMKYVMYTEKGVFNKNLYRVQWFSFLYLFLFLILGMILAWRFSVRQYKPLSGIVEVLKKVSGNKSPERGNEYMEIESSISMILQESAKLSREARKRNSYVRERAVVNLLNGRVLNPEMKTLLPPPEGKMTVVRLICDEENAQSFGNDLDLMQFAVKNVAEEIFSHIAEVFPAELDGAVSLLLYLKQGVLKNAVFETAEQFQKTMKTQVQIETEIILGGITDEMAQLPAIYSEVLEVSQFCTGYGGILKADILSERKPEAYNYSVQTEMDIIFCVKNGDFDGANEIISRELNEIIHRKNYPIYLIRCFMIELASTILKAAGEVKKSRDDDMNVQLENIGKLFSSTSIAEMESIVRKYLKEICEFVIDTNSRCSSSICEEIKQYVKENYADSEMNVSALAEKFYLNPSYLSSMFKKNTDMKLLEYINQVRIEEAKKLMVKKPDLGMEQLAEMTGFANSRSFRRIFSKYAEVPPSKFIKL